MLVGSHSRIGSFVYRFIITKYIPYSPIDKILFKTGNVLPDISKNLSKLDHTVEGSSNPYKQHIRKSQDTTLSSAKRMISLGVMCHFLCDYFCIYHAKEEFINRSIVPHLLYEFKLHFILSYKLLFSKKLYKQLLDEKEMLVILENVTKINQGKNSKALAVHSLLNSLQRSYHLQKPSIRTDIDFALRATLISSTLLMEEFVVSVSGAKAPAIKIPSRVRVFNFTIPFDPFISSLSLNLKPLRLQHPHLQKPLPT